MKRTSIWILLFLLLFPVSVFAQLDRGNPFQGSLLGATTPAGTPGGGQAGYPGTAIGGTTTRLGSYKEAVLTLVVTSLSARSGENLSVWVQHSTDAGDGTWTDLGRFDTIVGSDTLATAKRVMFWSSQRSPGPYATSEVIDVVRAPEDRSLAAGTVNMGPIGPNMRVAYNWNSLTASFTFSVTGFFRQ